jgi:branched-subunit amino acid aminotransferase/4-amino-4-deoxychorismate lyase
MPSPFGLYAVTAGGPHLLTAATGAVHDLFDHLPAGAYSGFRTYPGGRVHDLPAHLGRTERSLHLLGMESDFDQDAARLAVHRLTSDHLGTTFRLRLEVLPASISTAYGRVRVLLGATPLVLVPDEQQTGGVWLGLAPGLTRPTPRAKASAFAARRRPHPLYARDDYDRLLTDPAGRVLEGTSCNVTFIRGGTLLTAGDGVLEGITLRHVLSLAIRNGIPVRHPAPRVDELDGCDGGFVTSAARGVVPVVGVAGRLLGNGRPHPLALALARAYQTIASITARRAIPDA